MKKILISSILLGLSASANASVIFFGEDLNPGTSTANSSAAKDNFFASLVGAGTEDFESFSTGSSGPLTADFGAAGTATLSGSGAIDNGGYGRFATSGTKFWETNQNFTIEFSQAISAFGFYGTDIGDFGGQITLDFLSGSSTSYTVDNSTNAPDGTLLYWGIIDTLNPFTKITFGNTNSTDVFGFDDMTIANQTQVLPSQVSEPTSALMLGLGLLGFAASRRKKK
ncbi:PEP-CTERM sorting domain-containing protein [Agarivorans sp. B2Z047]|uniref:PEP-CTERM sorting domain-containing protein n=1 Tax=Agarivorans sp. B2Z047 TaxID=2652721 RepID=UPI00128AE2E7|nr:PEP-CTERM sorting domain-containing protein [Agarivorans sp. B2Z047]MPW28063.1 PEP-CTERM sorting domain-containing protein [Agarivorans sp. B2Z047]UQN44108.1 PEP-CTERM sorting domain-containing protein [Agarivorans sp. B2Z047]